MKIFPTDQEMLTEALTEILEAVHCLKESDDKTRYANITNLEGSLENMHEAVEALATINSTDKVAVIMPLLFDKKSLSLIIQCLIMFKATLK